MIVLFSSILRNLHTYGNAVLIRYFMLDLDYPKHVDNGVVDDMFRSTFFFAFSNIFLPYIRLSNWNEWPYQETVLGAECLRQHSITKNVGLDWDSGCLSYSIIH